MYRVLGMQYEIYIKIQLVIYYISIETWDIFHKQNTREKYENDRTAILLKSLFEAHSHKYSEKCNVYKM